MEWESVANLRWVHPVPTPVDGPADAEYLV